MATLFDFNSFPVNSNIQESSKDQEIDDLINQVIATHNDFEGDLNLSSADSVVPAFSQEDFTPFSFDIGDQFQIPNYTGLSTSVEPVSRESTSSPSNQVVSLFDCQVSDVTEEDVNMDLDDFKTTTGDPFTDLDLDVILEDAFAKGSQHDNNYTYSALPQSVNPGEYLSQDFFTDIAPRMATFANDDIEQQQIPRDFGGFDVQLDEFKAAEKKKAVKIVQKRQVSTVAEGSKNKPSTERVFDYDGIEVPYTVSEEHLHNHYQVSASPEVKNTIAQRLAEPLNDLEQDNCVVSRTRYTRGDLSCLQDLHANVRYEKNPLYSPERPYQQEFTRVEIDPSNDLPFNQTRSGLCAYCPNLKFSTIKNSNYCQHLVCEHGIYPDNYLAPAPYNYGSYYVKKDNTERVTKAQFRRRNGVICPVCHKIIEANCTKKTAHRPLINYLRHFRDCHRVTKFYGDSEKYCERYS